MSAFRVMLRLIAMVSFVVTVTGCGDDASPDPADFGNLLASPEGLIVVAEEHPSGWAKPDCFTCHEIRNMHTVNRTGIPDLDLAEVRAIVHNQGEASCRLCHGDNGVEQ